ncbi:MAG: permease, partial [Acidothermaceae bacterium]
GEIPILQGLSALGVGAGPLGALLITLPAVSLPSMAMVGRALSWRVTAAVAGVVMVTGLAGAILLSMLS